MVEAPLRRVMFNMALGMFNMVLRRAMFMFNLAFGMFNMVHNW